MTPDHSMAVANNVQWYSTMAKAHGVAFEQTGTYWCADEAMPPYYSNYVVAKQDGAHLARIDELLRNERLPRLTVADSFASLDEAALKDRGFTCLFEARWYGAAEVRAAPAYGTTFLTVETAEQLSGWEARWRAWSPTDHPRVFPSSLLRVPGVTFRNMIVEGQAVGGALTHEGAAAVGLSNVFFRGEAAEGNALRSAAATVASANPIVGYGTQKELDALKRVGFEDLGPHRVWIRGT